jgi:hypothetical protein
MPTEATPAAAEVAEGPEFGRIAIGLRSTYTRRDLLALAGEDQETHGAAGTRDVS